MKSRGGAEESRREEQKREEEKREEKKKEYQKRESFRRKKIQVREKVGKPRDAVFFQWFVAPEGRKVGSLKRRVRSQLARWEMKNCTPLWREPHFQVKMHKTHQVRTTFGSCDVEKVHAVVARSTCPSQNAQSTPDPARFWKLRCRKSARHCGGKHMSKSKCTKHLTFGPLLEVEMWKKCTPFWCKAHFRVKNWWVRTTFGSCDVEKVHAVVAWSTFRSQNVQSTTCSPLLDTRTSFRVAGARDCGPCQKSAKREGFVAFPKTMAGVGHLKSICKDAFSLAAVQETCSSELLGGPGADFLRGVAFWSLRFSGLLRWFCVTGAALRTTWHHFFVAGAVV